MVVAGAPGDNVFVVLAIGVGEVNEVLFADCQPVTFPVLLPRVSADAAVPLHSVWFEVTVPPAVTGFTVTDVDAVEVQLLPSITLIV